LAPQLKTLGPDIAQAVEQARGDLFAILTPDAQPAVFSKRNRNRK
jgi:hypothetical protein